MPELSGSLGNLGLGPLLRMLYEIQKNGRLHFAEDGWNGELFLEDGQVIAAYFGEPRGLGAAPSGMLRGLAALDAIVLMMPRGTFFLADGGRPPERNVSSGAPELNARLNALMDERAAAWPEHITLSAVPRRVELTEQWAPDDELIFDRAKLHLLLAIDGKRKVGELMPQMDLLRGIRDLSWLMSRGLVRLAGPGDERGSANEVLHALQRQN